MGRTKRGEVPERLQRRMKELHTELSRLAGDLQDRTDKLPASSDGTEPVALAAANVDHAIEYVELAIEDAYGDGTTGCVDDTFVRLDDGHEDIRQLS